MQASLPLGFARLGAQLGVRCVQAWAAPAWLATGLGLALPLAGFAMGWRYDSHLLPLAPTMVAVLLALLVGAPILAVLGELAQALFWSEGLPLASIALSHDQITVNPSLPALPLFTLAGLVLARTGAAPRLGAVFVVLFGGVVRGTVVAVAVLCSGLTCPTLGR